MNKRLSDTMRIIGLILIVMLGLLGSIIYLCLPREATPPSTRLRRRIPGKTGSRVASGVSAGTRDQARPRGRLRARPLGRGYRRA
jgi:hypothetical protein